MGTQPGPAARTAGPVPGAETTAYQAVAAAVQAPSVHNTQPWWFHHGDRDISVHSDADRRLAAADPQGREMLMSCGAAVFTLRAALRHLGQVPETEILPEPGSPDLVARVRWAEQAPPAPFEEQIFAAIGQRHTHRGAFLPRELPGSLLTALAEAAAGEGAALRLAVTEDERAALAAVVSAAEHAIRLDTARAREVAQWTRAPGSARPDGVPPTAYPAIPGTSAPEFPGRDYAHGQGWGLPPSMMAPLHHQAGVVCLLVTDRDEPRDWIAAGQALQRVLLTASVHGAAAALHSQPLELPELREFTRAWFSGHAYPQMLLRFGITDEMSASVRRPAEDVLL